MAHRSPIFGLFRLLDSNSPTLSPLFSPLSSCTFHFLFLFSAWTPQQSAGGAAAVALTVSLSLCLSLNFSFHFFPLSTVYFFAIHCSALFFLLSVSFSIADPQSALLPSSTRWPARLSARTPPHCPIRLSPPRSSPLYGGVTSLSNVSIALNRKQSKFITCFNFQS